MKNYWLAKCVNCGTEAMVASSDDNCQFCGKCVSKKEGAMERACQALNEINKMELDNPGISAQAVAEKLDITQEKIDLLYTMIGRFKKSLRQRRVKALC